MISEIKNSQDTNKTIEELKAKLQEKLYTNEYITQTLIHALLSATAQLINVKQITKANECLELAVKRLIPIKQIIARAHSQQRTIKLPINTNQFKQTLGEILYLYLKVMPPTLKKTERQQQLLQSIITKRPNLNTALRRAIIEKKPRRSKSNNNSSQKTRSPTKPNKPTLQKTTPSNYQCISRRKGSIQRNSHTIKSPHKKPIPKTNNRQSKTVSRT